MTPRTSSPAARAPRARKATAPAATPAPVETVDSDQTQDPQVEQNSETPGETIRDDEPPAPVEEPTALPVPDGPTDPVVPVERVVPVEPVVDVPPAAKATPVAPEPHELPLSEDPDTSLVQSVLLHLLSEHGAWTAIGMDRAGAIALHERLHRQAAFGHEVDDLRFRPALAQNAMLDRHRRFGTE
jgi:hypothetical protein